MVSRNTLFQKFYHSIQFCPKSLTTHHFVRCRAPPQGVCDVPGGCMWVYLSGRARMHDVSRLPVCVCVAQARSRVSVVRTCVRACVRVCVTAHVTAPPRDAIRGAGLTALARVGA